MSGDGGYGAGVTPIVDRTDLSSWTAPPYCAAPGYSSPRPVPTTMMPSAVLPAGAPFQSPKNAHSASSSGFEPAERTRIAGRQGLSPATRHIVSVRSVNVSHTPSWRALQYVVAQALSPATDSTSAAAAGARSTAKPTSLAG